MPETKTNNFNDDFQFVAFVDGFVKGTYGRSTLLAYGDESVLVPTSLIRECKDGKRHYLKAPKTFVFTVRTSKYNETAKQYIVEKVVECSAKKLSFIMKDWADKELDSHCFIGGIASEDD